jgi:hypothetical protein
MSRIMSLYAEKNDLQFAVPGGLIGVGTKIDPTLTRADRLLGQVEIAVSLSVYFGYASTLSPACPAPHPSSGPRCERLPPGCFHRD